VAVNALGDIVNPETGNIIAGARSAGGSGFADSMMMLRQGRNSFDAERNNTVIGVVATNATFDKSQCNKIAAMAHNGLARCVYPAHMPWDGDTIFAISTGSFSPAPKPVDVGIVGAMAADVLARAILRGVERAETWGAYPSARDFPPGRQ
jgi:L-aminopeptidase/D-esterase-like protein